MRKLGKVLSMIMATLLTTSLTGCIVKTQEAKDKTVLAKINDTTITVGDMKKQMQITDEVLKSQFGNDYATNQETKNQIVDYYYKSFLNSMVEQKVLYFKAKDLKLVPDLNNIDAEVQKEVDRTIKDDYGNDENKFNDDLKAKGETLQVYKDDIKEALKENPEYYAARRAQDELTKDITVTDDEVGTYYTSNITQYTTQPGANLSHILVATEQEAKDIKAQLDNGADFAELAKKYSTDTGSKDNGGSLGYVTYENSGMVEEFITAAKKLKEGEISGPVKSQFGYHIIKATGVNEKAKVSTLEEVKDTIKSTLLNQKKSEKINSEMETLKKTYKVKTYEDRIIKNAF